MNTTSDVKEEIMSQQQIGKAISQEISFSLSHKEELFSFGIPFFG